MPFSSILTALLPPIVLVGVAILFFLGGRLQRAQRLWGPLCVIAILIAGICLGYSSQRMVDQESDIVPASSTAVQPQIPSIIVEDRLSVGFQWMCLLLGILFALMSFADQLNSPTAAQHFGLLLFVVAGTMLVGMANDLIILFLALELTGLSTTALLILSSRRSSEITAVIQHLLLHMLVSAIVLYGFSLLYGLSASTNLSTIRDVLAENYRQPQLDPAEGIATPLGVAAMLFLFVGLGFWMSLVPFQFTTIDLFDKQNTWSCGLLAVVPKAVGLMVFTRLLVYTMPGFEATGQLLAVVLAGITMTVGSVMALLESRIRRLLVYVTIAQGGFALVGIAAAFRERSSGIETDVANDYFPSGIQAALFFLFTYSLAIVGFFAVLNYLTRKNREMEYIDDLKGIIRMEPLAAISAVVCLCSLVGMPPFAGFWGRWLVILSTLNAQTEAAPTVLQIPLQIFVVVAIIAVVHVVLTAAVSLRLISVILFDEPLAQPKPTGGKPALTAAIIAALLIIVIGLLPGLLLDFVR